MTDNKIGFLSAVSIGIGGMVGGGIFAVLGLAVQMAAGGTFLSFLIGGFIAFITSYSYAKLSVTYPSPGGTVEFLNQAFGTGVFSGGLNILLWLSYVVMLSLYAYAFGSYGASFFPESHALWRHVFITGIVILMTLLNLLSSRAVGEAEEGIVAFKIAILLLFILAGLWSVKTNRLTPDMWSPPLQLISGGMIIFLAYEGFELIANTAGDVKDIKKLPLAFYTSVAFVILIYFTIAIVAVGNLPYEQIVASEDYALATAAKPFLGSAGFVLIAIAALLSTSSAINATLYGSAKICYIIAKEGELPEILERKVWNKPVEGLFITSGITLIIANLLNLESISTIGSGGFLIIFGFVNLANAKLSSKTNSYGFISLVGAFACFSALIVLAQTDSNRLGVFLGLIAVSFVVEYVYRKISKREISPTFR